MHLLCYGDSNTYGYDPRNFLGGRYDAADRWCNLLGKATGWAVHNCGANGRSIPMDLWELSDLIPATAPDLLILWLGTNDVLLGARTVPQVEARMENLLTQLQEAYPKLPILLLSPPPVTVPGLGQKMVLLEGQYEKLAAKHRIFFCPTGTWGLDLAYDGVHLSPLGHRQCADRLLAELQQRGFSPLK